MDNSAHHADITVSPSALCMCVLVCVMGGYCVRSLSHCDVFVVDNAANFDLAFLLSLLSQRILLFRAVSN